MTHAGPRQQRHFFFSLYRAGFATPQKCENHWQKNAHVRAIFASHAASHGLRKQGGLRTKAEVSFERGHSLKQAGFFFFWGSAFEGKRWTIESSYLWQDSDCSNFTRIWAPKEPTKQKCAAKPMAKSNTSGEIKAPILLRVLMF